VPVRLIGLHTPLPSSLDADEEGLLAIGGNIGADYLLEAYRRGIFPWNDEGMPPFWYSPNPRMVLKPNNFKLSKSMRLFLRKRPFTFAKDERFEEVLWHCSMMPRHGQSGTWLHSELRNSLTLLYEKGFAHSIEVYQNKKLVGGLYGIRIGKMFFGESMFSIESNSSKAALFTLCCSLPTDAMIDCQQVSKHLISLGAEIIDRSDFENSIQKLSKEDFTFDLANPYAFIS
jgi:leucyl/phenylalanyl-tRNA--protein transferase